MKKSIIFAVTIALSMGAGVAIAEQVHDWHDLNKVHEHVKEAIHEMERAAHANHYDMDGHASRAEEHLRAAERELNEAVESAKRESYGHPARQSGGQTIVPPAGQSGGSPTVVIQHPIVVTPH